MADNSTAPVVAKLTAGDLDATIRLVKETQIPATFELEDGKKLVLAPANLQAHYLPALNPVLADRVKAAVSFVEPQSLIDYVNRFKSSTAICTASLDGTKFRVELDYHLPSTDGAGAEPSTNDHDATLTTPFFEDYAKWKAVFGKPLDQLVYVEFIEDMLHTIAAPAGADLLEIISDLKVKRDVAFKSIVNTRDGTAKLAYEEQDEHHAKGTLSLPETITLALPVFIGSDPIAIEAKLRYRLNNGSLKFIVAVPGLDKIEREQFRVIGDRIASECSIPVYYAA